MDRDSLVSFFSFLRELLVYILNLDLGKKGYTNAIHWKFPLKSSTINITRVFDLFLSDEPSFDQETCPRERSFSLLPRGWKGSAK